MNISYNWKIEVSEEKKSYIEERVSPLILQDCKPCHIGILLVHLYIDNPLDNNLEGEVNCSCGKKVCSFQGDSLVKIISFNKDENVI